MPWWRQIIDVFSRRADQDLDRELRNHLDLEAEEQREAGRSPSEAQIAARRAFGNTTRVKETVREMWGWASLERFWQDVLYGIRIFARSPGFTATVVLTLALGIGLNTALFSVVNAVILRPLPYKDSDRLVVIWKKPVRDANGTKMFDNYQEFESWQRNSKSFEQLAITTWATGGKILTGRGHARTVLALPASINFFQLLGNSPGLGRTFQNDDLERGCSIIVRHRFWESVLGGDKNIIGRNLRLDNQDCTVTGVMPAGFTFYPDAASMWILVTPVSDIVRKPDQSAVGVFGRLKAGLSIASAQQEIQTLYRQAHQHQEEGQDLIPMVYPLQEEFAFLTGPNLRLSLLILFGAVNCVLLIACVNVANLMLGRSQQRQRELAVRSALGSGRGRLIRQLLTEALLLSVSGAVLGALLAFAAVHYFRLANPVEMPPGNPVTVSTEVLGFTAALAVLTALAFGLIPAWTATKVDLNDVLKAAGRGASQGRAGRAFGKALVVAEVTLSVVLLVGASLLIQTVIRFTAVPLGFSTDHLLTMPVTLPKWHYSQPGQRAKFYERVVDNIRNISGIQRFALASSLPLNNGRWAANALTIQGQPEPSSQASVRDVGDASITPDYFEAMRIPLRMGRPFDSRDREGAEPTAIVNEALVRKYFGHEDPIGKRILVGKPGKDVPWLTIVGVSANEKETDFFQEMSWRDLPFVFRPVAQKPPEAVSVIVRTADSAHELEATVRRRIALIDTAVPVGDTETMTARVTHVLAYPRFRAVLLGTFAGLALLLAVVGLYGVVSQTVTQRTHEIGIRMALGAQKGDVLNMVIRQGLVLVGLGVIAGLLAAWLLTRLLAVLLYGVKADDAFVPAAASLTLLFAGFLAAYLPARRAAHIDPTVALRYE